MICERESEYHQFQEWWWGFFRTSECFPGMAWIHFKGQDRRRAGAWPRWEVILSTMPTALFPTLSSKSRTAQLRKRSPTFSPNGFLAAFLQSWIEMSTKLKWLKSAKLTASPKGSFASFWNLIPLLPSVEQGNLGVFPTAGRQPLVVHGNAASGKVLGVECVGWCY